MALQVQVQINGTTVHTIEARRVSHLDELDPDPDAVVTYDVELHGLAGRIDGTSVDHRHGDGALGLAARALDALAIAPAPRAVVLA